MALWNDAEPDGSFIVSLLDDIDPEERIVRAETVA